MTQTKISRSAVFFIFMTVLLDTIGFGIILPVLPGLIMELTGKGLSAAAIYGGWLWFVFAVLQFFCAPLLGNLSDQYGRRPVILFSLFALGLDYLVMGLAPTIAWLFVGRAVAGMAGASYTPAYAYLADISPPEKRAQNFGLVGAAFGMGFILGPAIGGVLGELGPRAPFFAAAGIALVNVVFGYFVLPESLARESRRPFSIARANPLGTLLQLRNYPVVVGLAGVLFLWQLGIQSLPSTWSFYTMFRFGWSKAAIGYSLAFAGLIMDQPGRPNARPDFTPERGTAHRHGRAAVWRGRLSDICLRHPGMDDVCRTVFLVPGGARLSVGQCLDVAADPE